MLIQLSLDFQIVSLLKHTGISLAQLQTLSCDPDPEEDDEDFRVNTDAVLEMDISRNELAVICYVAGYIAQSLGKRAKCKECEKLFITNRDLPSADYSGEECTSFIRLLTRGRLKSPSDDLFVFCRYCYAVFLTLQLSSSWIDFLKLKSPSKAFSNICLEGIRNSPISSILDSACSHDHRFSDSASFCTSVFFNVLAKNFIQSVEKMKNKGQSSSKIRKLRSNK